MRLVCGNRHNLMNKFICCLKLSLGDELVHEANNAPTSVGALLINCCKQQARSNWQVFCWFARRVHCS